MIRDPLHVLSHALIAALLATLHQGKLQDDSCILNDPFKILALNPGSQEIGAVSFQMFDHVAAFQRQQVAGYLLALRFRGRRLFPSSRDLFIDRLNRGLIRSILCGDKRLDDIDREFRRLHIESSELDPAFAPGD